MTKRALQKWGLETGQAFKQVSSFLWKSGRHDEESFTQLQNLGHKLRMVSCDGCLLSGALLNTHINGAANVLYRSSRGQTEARSTRAACAPSVFSSSSTSRCISQPTQTSSYATTAGAASHDMSLSRNTSVKTGWSSLRK